MSFIIDPLLRLWLRSCRSRWSHIYRRLFERKYLKTDLPVVSSLADIEVCMKHIKWTGDGPLHLYDCISYAQTTWAKKEDDCDGFASLVAELLDRWHPECGSVLLTVGVRPVKDSHTVCVFTSEQGDLCFFDNAWRRCEGYRMYSEIVAKISQGKRLVCWDVKDPSTLQTLEFHTI
jgi:hypothetical protein